MRYFNDDCTRCQCSNQNLGAGAVFGVQVCVPLVEQIHRRMGAVDDFLQAPAGSCGDCLW